MNDEIFKISKDKEREEFLKIIPTDKAYIIIEEYGKRISNEFLVDNDKEINR